MTATIRRHTCAAPHLDGKDPACSGCRQLRRRRRAQRLKRQALIVAILGTGAGSLVDLVLGARARLLTIGVAMIPVIVMQNRLAWLRETRRDVIDEATAAGVAMTVAGTFIAAALGLIGFFR